MTLLYSSTRFSFPDNEFYVGDISMHGAGHVKSYFTRHGND